MEIYVMIVVGIVSYMIYKHLDKTLLAIWRKGERLKGKDRRIFQLYSVLQYVLVGIITTMFVMITGRLF